MDASSQPALYTDRLSGLPNAQGWANALDGGVLPGDGTLIIMDVAGLAGVNQTFGHEAGDLLLTAVAKRGRGALPGEAVLMRGTRSLFFVWLPGVVGMAGEAFTSHLRQAICTEPVTFLAGEQVHPRAVIGSIPVGAGTRAQDALQTLERELVRRPEYAAPAGLARTASVRDELNHRLEAVRLFGMDGLIEEILSRLRLPGMEPRTVVVVGPPQAGKTRLLNAFRQLVNGQHLPCAEVVCRPSEQAVPFTLAVALIYQFLASHPPDDLRARFAVLAGEHAWLRGLFPALQEGLTTTAPQPPNDVAALRVPLRAILLHLARTIPHLAIVHSLQLADDASLGLLMELQATSGHGLRVVGGADMEEGGAPAALQPLLDAPDAQVRLGAFTREQVQTYLQEVVPDLAQPSIAASLHRLTGGLPLAVEATLRSWAEDGLLGYVDGHWLFFPEKVEGTGDLGLSAVEQERLAVVALADELPFEALPQIWGVGEAEARATVDRGRRLGYLASAANGNATTVRFADREHADGVVRGLGPVQVRAIHARLGARLEASTGGDARFSADLAYHFAAAGETERAQHYSEIMDTALPTLMPTLLERQNSAVQGVERWDIPPALPVGPEDVEALVEVVLMVRLVGVQLRLYPEASAIVQQAVATAEDALGRLLGARPSFVISYDGRTVAFDGQLLRRRDVQIAVRDYEAWMQEASLMAIGFAGGVSGEELRVFLRTFVTKDEDNPDRPMLDRLLTLNLPHIRVLSRPATQDLNFGGGGGSGGPTVPLGYVAVPAAAANALASVVAAMPAPPEGMTGSAGQMPTSPASGPTPACVQMVIDELSRLMNAVGAAAPVNAPGRVEQGGAVASAMPPTAGPSPTAGDPSTMDAEKWQRLPMKMDQVAPNYRRQMMANLSRWLREHAEAPLPTGVDVLLAQRLEHEEDTYALQETAAAAEMRMAHLLKERDWDGITFLIEPIAMRIAEEDDPQAKRQVEAIMQYIGANPLLCERLHGALVHPETAPKARQVMDLLGAHAVYPLLAALKTSSLMEERARIVQVLGKLGRPHLALLVKELRELNPWYVYRNLLQVVASIAHDVRDASETTDALTVATEKLRHPDARVRTEALTAAVRIAREQSAPHIILGLEDGTTAVVARALSLANVAQHPRILELLLRCVEPGNLSGEGADAGRAAAVMALGQYREPSAVAALLRILQPGMLGLLFQRDDALRAAAAAALGHHSGDIAVRQALERASNDRDARVCTAARRALARPPA